MSGFSEQRELEDGDYQNGDEIINRETQEKEFKIEENFIAAANWVSLPQKMTLHLRVCKFILYGTNRNFPSIFYLLTIFKTVQVGYDNTLKNRFKGSSSQKIYDAITHTYATFQHPSLGTKIGIQVHSWWHFNTNLFASNNHLSAMYQTTRNYLQGKMS